MQKIYQLERPQKSNTLDSLHSLTSFLALDSEKKPYQHRI